MGSTACPVVPAEAAAQQPRQRTAPAEAGKWQAKLKLRYASTRSEAKSTHRKMHANSQ